MGFLLVTWAIGIAAASVTSPISCSSGCASASISSVKSNPSLMRLKTAQICPALNCGSAADCHYFRLPHQFRSRVRKCFGRRKPLRANIRRFRPYCADDCKLLRLLRQRRLLQRLLRRKKTKTLAASNTSWRFRWKRRNSAASGANHPTVDERRLAAASATELSWASYFPYFRSHFRK